MKEKVYLDTTIPSSYFDERLEQSHIIATTHRWWQEMSSAYEVFVSPAVIDELKTGGYPNRDEILAFTAAIPLLERVPDIDAIIAFYVKNFVMPQSVVGDAAHLAYASHYGMDYLLTWNCNHLANANKKKHIRICNGRLGISTPEIVTPEMLFKET